MSRRQTAAGGAGLALQRLVDMISHRSGAVLSIMSDASVTLPQVLLLSRVAAIGSSSPSDIALEAQASAPAASQMIERLVQQRLLLRKELPDDRRRKLISPTRKARALLGRLEAARAADYDLGLAPLSSELRNAMALLLQRAVNELAGAQENRGRRQRVGKMEVER
jgi:DNA-binding MarR family transcriptional regulator